MMPGRACSLAVQAPDANGAADDNQVMAAAFLSGLSAGPSAHDQRAIARELS
jgi:hypothetical protein